MRWFTPATLLLMGWGALAFGAEYPWAYAPLLVFGATIGVLGLVARAPGGGRFRSLGLALGLVATTAGVQAVPLPRAAVTVLSPARSAHDWRALYAEARPAVPGRVGEAESEPSTISVAPSRTVLGLAFVAGLSLFFLGAARALSAAGPSGVARGLVVLGVVVALAGLAQAASGSPAVYGVWYPRKAWTPAAPFINPNHFAGWMVMALAVAAGLVVGGAARARRSAPPDWRRRAVWLGSQEASETVLAGFAVLVMALSILVTRSVSGMACLAGALGAFAWRASRRRAGWRRVLPPAGVAAALAGVAAWAGVDVVWGEIAETWSTAFDPDGRVGLWRDTARIVRDFPLTGVGFNAYGVAMLGYQTHGLDLRAVEAHNDYLQLAAEGGLMVGAPIVLAAGVFVREVRRRFREGRDDTRTRWLRVGAVIGLGAVGAQALVDFSLQMPGNAMLFALLMAMAVHRPGAGAARGRDRRPRGGRSVDTDPRGRLAAAAHPVAGAGPPPTDLGPRECRVGDRARR